MRTAARLSTFLLLTLSLAAGMACGATDAVSPPPPAAPPAEDTPRPENLAAATFAGGCFWCMEPPFDKLDGVYATISGYSGGSEVDPTYGEVSAGRTGHTEVVRVEYDPEVITYAELLDVFWKNIDPTTADRQFCDRGSQYRTAIYFHDEEQQHLAESTRDEIAESGRLGAPIVTEIEAAGPFYAAEEYHQDFYKKNPAHYKRYRVGCGRDRRLEQLWGE